MGEQICLHFHLGSVYRKAGLTLFEYHVSEQYEKSSYFPTMFMFSKGIRELKNTFRSISLKCSGIPGNPLIEIIRLLHTSSAKRGQEIASISLEAGYLDELQP